MSRGSGRWAVLAGLLFGASTAGAQGLPPDLGFVYPAGGRQGTTFEIKLAGQFCDGAIGLRFSGEGVEGKFLGQTRPLTQREINDIRKMLRDLEEKKTKTEADRKAIQVLRKKLVRPKVQPTPALAEVVTAEITIDAKAAPGPRQVRLRAKTGMSNPIVFMVGQLPEVVQKKGLIDPESPPPRPPDLEVTLPAVLNSQLMPGQVDRYRFQARQGQQLVFAAHARALIPFLADAVPGYFQAALTLYDSRGNEVAYADHFRHRQDPVLAYKVPRDGAYVLEIKDALYRGREDFVYRIEAGEIPFVTGIYPLGGRAGNSAAIDLEGWNLPVTRLTLEAGQMKPGVLPIAVRKGEWVSNTVPFAVDSLLEVSGLDAGDGPAKARFLTLPTIVNGRIAVPGKWNVFRFEGRKGQVVVAEVRARRLDSPLDAVLKLTDGSGKELAFNDDWEDKAQAPLHTHPADAMIRTTLPEDGTFFLHVGDAQGQGSPAHAYRLRVSGPQPDFELRVTPCSLNARPGSTLPITVEAIRKDGFAGPIDLFLTYDPVDFALDGARIPADQDRVRVTLQVPRTIRPRPIDLVLEGRANIEGRKVVRVAVPAEEVMQAFIYHHLVPAQDLMVTISGEARARFPARVMNKGPIRIPAGGSGLVYLAFPQAAKGNKFELVLSDPPEGITLKQAQMNKFGAVLLIEADGEKVRPGLRANLIVDVYPETARKAGARRPPPLGTLPAIPFEIFAVGKR